MHKPYIPHFDVEHCTQFFNTDPDSIVGVSLLLFKHALCSQVKGFRPHGLLVYRLCLPPDTPIIFNG